MHDPQYRAAVAWQNSAYNQPPHVSYYLGDSIKTPPRILIDVEPLATSTVEAQQSLFRSKWRGDCESPRHYAVHYFFYQVPFGLLLSRNDSVFLEKVGGLNLSKIYFKKKRNKPTLTLVQYK